MQCAARMLSICMWCM